MLPTQLKSIAVLERDLLKATGQPVPSEAPPAPIAESSFFAETAPLLPKLEAGVAAPAPVQIELNDTDMDDSFLNSSLFGDSTVTSPVAMDLTTSSSGAPTLPATSLPLNTGSAPPPSASVPANSDSPDFSSLLSMVNSSLPSMPVSGSAPPLAMPLPDFTPAAPFPGGSSSGGEADLNAMLSMLSGSGMAAGITAPLATTGMEDISFDAGANGMDFGSFGEMDAGSLDELLKSLGGNP